MDLSWIEESERIQSLKTIPLREQMKSIVAYFIFMDAKNAIQTVETETIPLSIPLSENISLLAKEQLLSLITHKKKRSVGETKYILKDTMMFHIDLEPEQLQKIHSTSTSSFFKPFRILNDLIIPPSLFIFHSINSLYFFFQETPLKSILKIGSRIGSQTKKVRISGTGVIGTGVIGTAGGLVGTRKNNTILPPNVTALQQSK